MKKYRFVFLTLLSGLMVNAQNYSHDSFFGKSSVGSFVTNPATIAQNNWDKVSFNVLPDMNIELQLPYTINSIFSKNISSNKYSLDFDQIGNRTAPNNAFYTSTAIKWVSIDGGSDEKRWNFSIQDRAMMGFGFQRSFIDLLDRGNKPYLAKPINMKFPFNELHFRTFQFSWAKPINDKLDFGISGKLYFGKSWIDVASDFSILTSETAGEIDLAVEGKGRASLPYTLEGVLNRTSTQSGLSNYFFGMNNPGFGFDMGIIYRFNKKVELTANVNDIGFIVWNSNTTTFTANGTTKWNGLELTGKFNFNQFNEIKEHPTIVSFRDSFLNELIKPVNENFITALPMAANAGFMYQYNRTLNIEVISRILFYGHFVRGYIAFNGAYALSQNVKLYSGLSITNHSLFNLPLGLSYQGRQLALSFMVNNVAGIILPNRSKNFGGSLKISYRVNKNKHNTSNRYPFFQRGVNKAVKILLFQNSE